VSAATQAASDLDELPYVPSDRESAHRPRPDEELEGGLYLHDDEDDVPTLRDREAFVDGPAFDQRVAHVYDSPEGLTLSMRHGLPTSAVVALLRRAGALDALIAEERAAATKAELARCMQRVQDYTDGDYPAIDSTIAAIVRAMKGETL
jgi:hypothetical protein